MTRRRPPKIIKVLGQRIEVDATHDHVVAEIEGYEGDQQLLGYSDTDQGIIMVAKHQGGDRMRETYIHETLHVVMSLTGLKRQFEGPNPPDHEEVVTRLSVALLALVRDNPTLLAYLTDRSPL